MTLTASTEACRPAVSETLALLVCHAAGLFQVALVRRLALAVLRRPGGLGVILARRSSGRPLRVFVGREIKLSCSGPYFGDSFHRLGRSSEEDKRSYWVRPSLYT